MISESLSPKRREIARLVRQESDKVLKQGPSKDERGAERRGARPGQRAEIPEARRDDLKASLRARIAQEYPSLDEETLEKILSDTESYTKTPGRRKFRVV